MTCTPPAIIVLIALLSAAPAALAKTPSPGDYETHHGWGTLSISAARHGAAQFQIDTVGTNGHVCSLSGKVKGGSGYADAGESDPQCFITFKAVPNGIEVSAKTPQTCREFCGANARFEGTYWLPRAACTAGERAARRNMFTTLSGLNDYPRAYATLNSFYGECGAFLNWVEIDAVRNDLAITQYHLGHNDACLGILKDTLGAAQTNEQELSTRLPPSDFETYLPVAQVTWDIFKQCGNPGVKSQNH